MPKQFLDAIRLRQLRLLALIDEQGSIGGAARRMHLTQPAVSQMLRELETALGATLALRDARGARLTDAARAALRRFGVALREIEAGAAGLLAGSSGVVLRVGTMPLAAVEWLPLTIAALRAAREPSCLQIVEGSVESLRNALADGDVDCIISRLEPGPHAADPAFAHEPLASDALVVACRSGHPALSSGGDFARLGDWEWVLPPQGLYTRRTLDGWFLSAGARPPRAAVESASFHLSLRVAAETDLLAVAPRSAFRMYRGLLPIEDVEVGRQVDTGEVALIHRRSIGDLPEFVAFRARLRAVARAPGG